MDIVTFLTLVVATAIVASGYFLFNGVPHFKDRQRQ